MKDNVGRILINNGSIYCTEDGANIQFPETGVVYEVIRIIDNVPLFLMDHYRRLKNSIGILGAQIQITYQQLLDMINTLTAKNGLSNCNVKLLLNNEKGIQQSLLYISKSYYPSSQEYSVGVPVNLFYKSRSNPNAKIADSSYKEDVAAKIAQDKVFEVLLVNDRGYLTEGSRSNLFMVSNKTIFTAPGEYVLKGITRQYVIDACRDTGFEIVEKLNTVDDLYKMDSIFISGTSIKVLPVSRIGDFSFHSGDSSVVKALHRRYDEIIESYINENSVK